MQGILIISNDNTNTRLLVQKFTCAHERITVFFRDILKHSEAMPKFLTQGNTYLLPKTMPPGEEPSIYRPISCLVTLYKLLTGILANGIYVHMYTRNLLPEEQTGCKRKAQCCKDQLIIYAVSTQDAKKYKNDLHSAFIHHRKAFDSVPPGCLIVQSYTKQTPRLSTYTQK